MSDISGSIRRLRKERNMTQDQLAEKLIVTRQAVSNWENGKTQPDVETLERIAGVFEVSLEELIYGKKRSSLSRSVKNSGSAGIGFGAALAIVISYVEWHSIGWAMLHGALGWIYVIYYAIRY